MAARPGDRARRPHPGAAVAGVYYYVTLSRLIDARLHGERERVLPRVFARPLELRRGQSMTERQLVDRLNDLGYTLRGRADGRASSRWRRARSRSCRAPPSSRASWYAWSSPTAAAREDRGRPRQAAASPDRVLRLEAGGAASERVTLETAGADLADHR